MKKIIYLIVAIFATTLVACSSDDDNGTDTSGANLILPKTITYNEDEYSVTSTITYNGSKIVDVTEGNEGVYKYTYTGDNITNVKYYEKDNAGAEVLKVERKYTYEDDKLVTYERNDRDYESKTIYTHNSDGTIDYTEQYYENSSKGKITMKDGNVVKDEEYNEDGSVSYSQTFEYDDKNNPVVNILGINKLLDDLEDVSKNNVIKRTTNYGADTYEYEYNDKGYPTKKTKTSEYGSYINEYTY